LRLANTSNVKWFGVPSSILSSAKAVTGRLCIEAVEPPPVRARSVGAKIFLDPDSHF